VGIGLECRLFKTKGSFTGPAAVLDGKEEKSVDNTEGATNNKLVAEDQEKASNDQQR